MNLISIYFYCLVGMNCRILRQCRNLPCYIQTNKAAPKPRSSLIVPFIVAVTVYILKVSKSRKQFLLNSPKKRTKNSTLLV